MRYRINGCQTLQPYNFTILQTEEGQKVLIFRNLGAILDSSLASKPQTLCLLGHISLFFKLNFQHILILEVFHKFEKAGGQATLSASTAGGKSKFKLLRLRLQLL